MRVSYTINCDTDLSSTPRAITRDCRPRHKKHEDEVGPPSESRHADSHRNTNQLGARGATPVEGYLGMALRRFNVQLFGAPWCEKCKQQKQMMYRMIGPAHWRDHYSDCGAAKCCLGCAGMKQVPLWKVNGRRYPGRFDVTQLAGIVGAQRPNQRGGRQATEIRAADAAARGDILGGLRPGEIPIGGRNRRHGRRAGWAKREAVKLALGQNRGSYWCEFGELMTPRMATAFGVQGPSGGGDGGGGGGGGGDGVGGSGGGGNGGGNNGGQATMDSRGTTSTVLHHHSGGAPPSHSQTTTTTVGAAGTPMMRATAGYGPPVVGGYKKAGWIPPDDDDEGGGGGGGGGDSSIINPPPPLGSLMLALTSLSLLRP